MKTIKLSLLTLITVLTMSLTPAHAVVGVFTLNGPLILGGLTASATGMVMWLPAMGNRSGRMSVFETTGLLISTVGLIALDGENQVSFAEISAEEAQSIGLTSSEVESYNSEVDQVNFLAQEVESILSSKKEPSLKDSKAAWDSLKDSIAPETFSAIGKISIKALSK